MPDITMCRSYDCKRRMECYRYRAIPHHLRQSYASFFAESERMGDGCVYFVHIFPSDKLTEVEE